MGGHQPGHGDDVGAPATLVKFLAISVQWVEMFVSDKPVQALGGNACSFMPYGVAYCDHLEDLMLRCQVVRVIATESNTILTYDPPPMAAPTTIARPGEFHRAGTDRLELHPEG